MLCFLDFNTTGYVADAGGDIVLTYTDGSGDEVCKPLDGADFVDQTADSFAASPGLVPDDDQGLMLSARPPGPAVARRLAMRIPPPPLPEKNLSHVYPYACHILRKNQSSSSLLSEGERSGVYLRYSDSNRRTQVSSCRNPTNRSSSI